MKPAWRLFSAVSVFCSLASPIGASATCNLQFSGPSGAAYSDSDLARFVETEIRPRLSNSSGNFAIGIAEQCPGAAPVSLTVNFDQTDYYITAVQGHQLTGPESKYVNGSLALSRANLEAAIQSASAGDGLPSDQWHDVVKLLAFFFAESARFSDVETAAVSLNSQNCAVDWMGYATLLRRWSKISRLALREHNNQWTARGGSSNQLIAPVTSTAIELYDSAVSAGSGGPLASYVDPADWGHPITLPSLSCH